MIRHVPNLISALRLVAAPFAAWLILNAHDTAALAVFAAAGASDGLDGFVARRWGVASNFGAWLDAAADKLLMLLCFTALYCVHVTPVWLVAVVVARDAAIAGGLLIVRLLALPVKMRALPIGKLSTVVQVLYISLMLLLLAFDLNAPGLTGGAAWITALVTFASGIGYGVQFLRGGHAQRSAP